MKEAGDFTTFTACNHCNWYWLAKGGYGRDNWSEEGLLAEELVGGEKKGVMAKVLEVTGLIEGNNRPERDSRASKGRRPYTRCGTRLAELLSYSCGKVRP